MLGTPKPPSHLAMAMGIGLEMVMRIRIGDYVIRPFMNDIIPAGDTKITCKTTASKCPVKKGITRW